MAMPSVKLCIESAIRFSQPLALRFDCIAAKRPLEVVVVVEVVVWELEVEVVVGLGVAAVLLSLILEDLRTAVGLARSFFVAVVALEAALLAVAVLSHSSVCSSSL